MNPEKSWWKNFLGGRSEEGKAERERRAKGIPAPETKPVKLEGVNKGEEGRLKNNSGELDLRTFEEQDEDEAETLSKSNNAEWVNADDSIPAPENEINEHENHPDDEDPGEIGDGLPPSPEDMNQLDSEHEEEYLKKSFGVTSLEGREIPTHVPNAKTEHEDIVEEELIQSTEKRDVYTASSIDRTPKRKENLKTISPVKKERANREVLKTLADKGSYGTYDYKDKPGKRSI